MKILQLRHSEIPCLSEMRYLVVESQIFGQEEDFRYHVAMSNKSADALIKEYFVREIKDTGRTVGFWQNAGGKGIFRPDAVSSVTMFELPDRVIERLKKLPPATISFGGTTWKEIIEKLPLTPSAKKGIGITGKAKATVASKDTQVA